MMPGWKLVTPDISMWEFMAEMLETLGAGMAVVLLALVAGTALSALAWAFGHSLSLPRLAYAGKWGVVGCLVGAWAVPAIGPMIDWIIGFLA